MITEKHGTKSQYQVELDRLASTYKSALNWDVAPLKQGIAGASGASVIATGSGASFTAASLLCSLHEAFTGRVSRPCTPLELVCNPTLASSSPVFLISAEGKNPDILEALLRARRNSARSVHILTNRGESPLATHAKQLTDVGIHVFEMAAKDGYLGTNSLLMNAVLLARTYLELDNNRQELPPSIHDLQVGGVSIGSWLDSATGFINEASKRSTLIVVFSPHFRPVAIDFESKLAESALTNCQLTDIRSFAHGRHLWLSSKASECALLALVDPSLEKLWQKMQQLLPSDVPLLTMSFSGTAPRDLLAGLVAQMFLVGRMAESIGKDPGRPVVSNFGRDMHYLELKDLVPPATIEADHSERSKHEVFGAQWPITKYTGCISRALRAFRSELRRREFRCIVFDYDGVLCRSQERYTSPSLEIVEQMKRLASAGVILGIASGRGGSVQECLSELIPEDLSNKIVLGLYNAGHIGELAIRPRKGETSEYLSHITRIIRNLKTIGVPILDIRVAHPYQVSVRFRDGSDANRNWFVVADALRHAGLDLLRVVRSKHSVDILGHNVGKSHLVAHIVQNHDVDPYEILTIGDQGAWPGNDASLLDHRYSLSVDEPSRRLDRGWKLAPSFKRDVDATLWYLDNLHLLEGGRFKLQLPNLEDIENER